MTRALGISFFLRTKFDDCLTRESGRNVDKANQPDTTLFNRKNDSKSFHHMLSILMS